MANTHCTATVFGFPLSVNTGSASGPGGGGGCGASPRLHRQHSLIRKWKLKAQGDESSLRRYTVTDRQSKDATGRC